MITDMLLPTLGIPLVVMVMAALASARLSWTPALGALLAVAGAFAWIQGLQPGQLTNPTAMDGIWLMTLVAVIASGLNRNAAAAVMLLGLPVGWWVVRVFADTIGPLAWFGQVLALLIPVALAWLWIAPRGAERESSFWLPAYLMAPAAILAPTIGLAGSLKLAELAGALGAVMAICWLLDQGMPRVLPTFRRSRFWQTLVPVLCLPLAWVGVVAYHLVEVSAIALVPAALPWLVGAILYRRTQKPTWPAQLGILVLVTALPMAFSLWYAWPEQSLY